MSIGSQTAGPSARFARSDDKNKKSYYGVAKATPLQIASG